MIKKIVKEPLLHFLAAGFALFLLYEWVGNAPESLNDPKHIVVDRKTLLNFIQYRTKVFKPELAAARLDGMPDEQRRAFIDQYVREEALHREAVELGLGREDYIIKRRMIQKVEFIAQGFADAAVKATGADLEAFYSVNANRYREPADITFTHVFFSAEGRGADAARALAEAKLLELRRDQVPFSHAPRHGERFPYGVNYVERTLDHVESHVGPAMTEALFAQDSADRSWHGPFISPYGAHLAMVAGKTEARTPELEEVRGRVAADFISERKNEQMEKAIDAIVADYSVEIDLENGD